MEYSSHLAEQLPALRARALKTKNGLEQTICRAPW